MTRHDEPAEGDVAGVAEVLAAHVYANPGCRCGWSRNHASGDGPRKWTDHVADALRDLLAAAEQRGRVAALREVEEALAPVDETWGGAAMVLRDRVRVALSPALPRTSDHTETKAEFLARTAKRATDRAQ